MWMRERVEINWEETDKSKTHDVTELPSSETTFSHQSTSKHCLVCHHVTLISFIMNLSHWGRVFYFGSTELMSNYLPKVGHLQPQKQKIQVKKHLNDNWKPFNYFMIIYF